MDLSIVIPAYNEAKRLGKTLDKIYAFLKQKPFSTEVIVVDDGSRDQTVSLVNGYQKNWPELKLMLNGINRGKGFSVKEGALAAQGRHVLFSDADLSTPIEEYEKLASFLNGATSVVIASRSVRGAQVQVHQAWYREMMGKTFNKIVRIFTGLPFNDTQCGFKLFTRDAVQAIFPKLRVTHYAFDVEALWLAKKQGFKVSEIPVQWVNNPDSRVDPIRDASKMLWDVIKMRCEALQGKYSNG